MPKITQIELKPKDCIFLVKSLAIQFTHQIISVVSIQNKERKPIFPIVTSANFHQTKYEVNNPKVISLSLNFWIQIVSLGRGRQYQGIGQKQQRLQKINS